MHLKFYQQIITGPWRKYNGRMLLLKLWLCQWCMTREMCNFYKRKKCHFDAWYCKASFRSKNSRVNKSKSENLTSFSLLSRTSTYVRNMFKVYKMSFKSSSSLDMLFLTKQALRLTKKGIFSWEDVNIFWYSRKFKTTLWILGLR